MTARHLKSNVRANLRLILSTFKNRWIDVHDCRCVIPIQISSNYQSFSSHFRSSNVLRLLFLCLLSIRFGEWCAKRLFWQSLFRLPTDFTSAFRDFLRFCWKNDRDKKRTSKVSCTKDFDRNFDKLWTSLISVLTTKPPSLALQSHIEK